MNAKDLVFQSGLVSHSHPLVFLVGAGISYEAPSGVPLANELTWNILDQLLPNKEELKEKFGSLEHFQTTCPRLETILDVAVESFGPAILAPLKILSDVQPNRMHRLLQELSSFTPILTTNLDCGIENASTDPNLRVVANESLLDKQSFPPLLKIHGSADLNIHEMGVTINSIRHGYSSYIEHLLTTLWHSNGALVICGYSGLDTCDLWRYLRRARAFKSTGVRIYWIDHDKSRTVLNPKDRPSHMGFEIFDRSIPNIGMQVLSGTTYDIVYEIREAIFNHILGSRDYERITEESATLKLHWPSITEKEKETFKVKLYDRLLITDLALNNAINTANTDESLQVQAAFRAGIGSYINSDKYPTVDIEVDSNGSLGKFSEIMRLSGATVLISSFDDLHEMNLLGINISDVENIMVGRSTIDQENLEFIAEWLITAVDLYLTTKTTSINEAGVEAIHQHFYRFKDKFLKTLIIVISVNGSRLLSTKSGIKIAAVFNYLKDTELITVDDVLNHDAFSNENNAHHMFEILVASDFNDTFWSAFYTSDFGAAFDTVRLHLESHIKLLACENVQQAQVQQIYHAHKDLLERLQITVGMTGNFVHKLEATRLRMVFTKFFQNAGNPSELDDLKKLWDDLDKERAAKAKQFLERFPSLALRKI